MSQPRAPLPIDDVLAEICVALAARNRLVLAAPPGAGKTSRVPLALAGLLDTPATIKGRILLLEPRRVAARMAARRMAQSLGEPLGKRIGLSTRVDRKVSKDTVIEVITDGLFTRRILADPNLNGVGAVIFDEIHERRLNMDLGLALVLEAQSVLRDDLRILLMSATLDTARVGGAIAAQIIESEGRQYPVETRYLGRSDARIEDRMAKAIQSSLAKDDGSILAFLPGAREIRRVQERLEGLGQDVLVAPLFGALSPAEQDAAVSPTKAGQRKVVLATDIAESALTIEGVTIVIDAGLARVAEESAGGLGSRLTTVKASLASVDQRRGRAGRTAPGICYRLWDEAATRGLNAAPQPEILKSDLAGLVLALAEWGEREPNNLTWLDTPPEGRVKAAQAQLLELGALDESGALSALGKDMAGLPLPPRLAALVAGAKAGGEKALAAEIAALAGERGLGGNSVDLGERLGRFRTDRSSRARTVQRQADRWGGGANPAGNAGALLARAWPGQIARRRTGDAPVFLLASGRAGQLQETDALARSDWLVVVELSGASKQGRVTLALAIDEQTALEHGRVETNELAAFDAATGKVSARRVKRLGAIILSEAPLPKPSAKAAAQAMLEAVARDGFAAIGAGDAVTETLKRAAVLAEANFGDGEPPSLEALMQTASEWLLPVLEKAKGAVPPAHAVRDGLIQSLPWQMQEALRQHAPLEVKLPSGQTARIDYLDERAPLVSARAQAFYGAARHPSIAGGRVALTVELLSPGHKPTATTQDLIAFWEAGYKDMVKDMRGRYPKHDWPDDPANAKPHEGRTKKRLSGDR
ncbi:UNVERIFIED_CONTAM: hypothetical protein GTU68_066143 [Idotea baltica]|nr:hypothetical protein [Idotea baltica]